MGKKEKPEEPENPLQEKPDEPEKSGKKEKPKKPTKTEKKEAAEAAKAAETAAKKEAKAAKKAGKKGKKGADAAPADDAPPGIEVVEDAPNAPVDPGLERDGNSVDGSASDPKGGAGKSKAVKNSYKTGEAHRKGWSDSYDGGFTHDHRRAATKIQKAFRKFRALRAAKKRREELENRKLTGSDKLAALVLSIFNIGGICAGLAGSIALWYYVLNCGETFDTGPKMCLSTTPTWMLFWVNVFFVFLCFLGIHGTSPQRIEYLRCYSFMLLLVVAAEISLVGMFALDKSAAMQGLQNQTYSALLTQACEMEPVIDDLAAGVDAGVGAIGDLGLDLDFFGDNATLVNGSVALNGNMTISTGGHYAMLCSCLHDPGTAAETCMGEFINERIQLMLIFFSVMIVIELIMSRLAWRFLGLPVEHDANQGDLIAMKTWLKDNDLSVYQKRLILIGVRSKEQLIDSDIPKLKQVGMSTDDIRRFLVAQGDSKVESMDSHDSLGLSGWDKLMVSHLAVDDDMKVSVSILIKTWYFESCVLITVFLTMWVLAKQSAAFPPTDEEVVVLQSVQTFVTIFFTLEILLEMVVVVTSDHSSGYFTDIWHLIDWFVLLVFWMYLLYPMFLLIPGVVEVLPPAQPAVISVLRVARVLRPLRTLRLLGDVTLVAQCISHSAHLFRDIVMLSGLVILLFSMIGISSFAGSLHYTCITCQEPGWDLDTIPQSTADANAEAFYAEGLAVSEKLQWCDAGQALVYEGRAWIPASSAKSADYPSFADWGDATFGAIECPTALRCFSQKAKPREQEEDIIRPDMTGWGWEKPVMCVAKYKQDDEGKRWPAWDGVGEDEYGTRSFDNIFQAFYTVFIHMTGDNGMQDLPNALWAADTTSQWMAWPLFAVATIMLTLILLNLFLAICCSAFEDIHNAVEQAKLQRENARNVKKKMKELENGPPPAADGEGSRSRSHSPGQAAPAEGEVATNGEPSKSKSMSRSPTRDTDSDSQSPRAKTGAVGHGGAVPVGSLVHGASAALHSPEMALALVDNVLDKTVQQTEDLLEGAREFMDNPGIGLNNMEEERDEMELIYDKVEKKGGWQSYVVLFVSSTLFELSVMGAICVYTLLVFGQDTFPELDGFKEILLQVEMAVIVLFVVEFTFKTIGLGFRDVLKFGENRLDFFILLLTVLGYCGTYYATELEDNFRKAAEAQANARNSAAEYAASQNNETWVQAAPITYDAGTFIKVVKISRITQLFRMTYKYKTMRDILATVFKTASTVAWLSVFVLFALGMFSLIMMHVMGGGCEEKYNTHLAEMWADPSECEYPEANFESFGIGFLTAFQIMTGEDWSEVMFWYYRFSPIKEYSAPFFMLMWVFIHGILFSLFVAVLLLNFAMDEDEKLPEQQEQYGHHLKKQQKKNKDIKNDLKSIVERDKTEATDGVADHAEGPGDDPVLGLFQAAEVAEVDDANHGTKYKSLFVFYLTSPVRVFACKIESHKNFEVTVLVAILISCLAMTTKKQCMSVGNLLGINETLMEEMANMANDTGMFELGGRDEKSVGECEGGFDRVALIQATVLFVFYVELVLRSISRGFALKAGPRAPYLRSGMNQIDFMIIVICTSTRIILPGIEDPNQRTYVEMLQSMAPMMSLVRHRGLRKIFGAFKSALPLIAVVSVPIVFLMGILGFIGVEIFGQGQLMQCMPLPDSLVAHQLDEKFPDSYCEGGTCNPSRTVGNTYLDDSEYASLNQTECYDAQKNGAFVEWKAPPFGFDNAFEGVITLLKAATAGVMPIQNVAIMVTGPGMAPELVSPNHAKMFFVVFHIIFTFFLLNLFIGVMSTSFSKSTGTMVVTTLQRRWVQCNNMIQTFAPHDDEHNENKPMPGDPFFLIRLRFYDFVTDRRFKLTTSLVIVLNCTILLLFHYPAIDSMVTTVIHNLDYGFLAFYFVEMIAKIIGFGPGGYFSQGWNVFDFSLVAISIFSAFSGEPSGIESLRVLRSLRVFLLAQHMTGLMSMIDTVLKCIVPALTIAAIMSVFLFLYSIAGMTLFGDAGIDHDYYNKTNNFNGFLNTLQLLFQVMFGQNYMWLTADLVAEGKSEFVVTMYFMTFFMVMVLINLNLFAVIVLDNFAAQNPVAQTISPKDLWAFTHAWAEQTIGAGSCPSLQRGAGAKILRNMRRHAKGLEDEASGSDSDSGDSEHEDDNVNLDGAGVSAMKKKAAKDAKRPTGVVRVLVEQVTGMPFNKDGSMHQMRPYVKLYDKPNGELGSQHTSVQTKTSGHEENTKTVYKEEFKVFIDQKSRSVVFEVVDQISGQKLAQARISNKVVSKQVDEISPETLILELTGPEKSLALATSEELEQIRLRQLASPRSGGGRLSPSPKSARSGSRSARSLHGGKSPKTPRGNQSPRAAFEKGESTTFRPLVGKIEVQLFFNEGMAMPRFDFMGDYADNNRFKLGGCGIEGWLWKRGGDALFPIWERRWMWLSIPSVHSPDTEPAIHYYKECDDEAELEDRGRHGTLVEHAIPADEIVEVHAKLIWDDNKEHKTQGRDAALLEDCEFQFTRAARVSDVSHSKRKESVYRFRALCPAQKAVWVAGLKWVKSAGNSVEHIESDTDTRSKMDIIEEILARLEKNQGERAQFHAALAAELDSHSIEELRHRDWLEKLKETRPARLPIPPINARDVERIQNNPAILGMPFSRVRFMLIDLNRHQALGCHSLSREWLLYTLFNLEMCAMNRNINKTRQKDALKSHIGCYISEIRGLNYMQTLRRLCLLHYEKSHSLMFGQQVEEYQHDLHKIALAMISTALSGWILGKALPAYHSATFGKRDKKVLYGKSKEMKAELKKAKASAKAALIQANKERAIKGELPIAEDKFDADAHRHDTYPANTVWRRLPHAHQIAVVGVASLRLDSLAVLMRAIKKEKPALLHKQDKEREAERKRVNALTDEQKEEEAKAEAAKAEEERIKEERRARRRGGCLNRGKGDGKKVDNPMNPDEGSGSPMNDSLMAADASPLEKEEAAKRDEPRLSEMKIGMGEAMANKLNEELDAVGSGRSSPGAMRNPIMDADANDDEEFGEDDSIVREETKAQYKEVFNKYLHGPKDANGQPISTHLDKKSAQKMIKEYYASALVESNLSASHYIKRYWADPRYPMCTDAVTGLSFEDYLRWQADNHSLDFGSREKVELPKSRADDWAASHQGTNEEMQAELEEEIAALTAEANGAKQEKQGITMPGMPGRGGGKKGGGSSSGQEVAISNPMMSLTSGGDGNDMTDGETRDPMSSPNAATKFSNPMMLDPDMG